MFCTLTPSAMMSNTAIARPASPAQASDVALPPSPWRAYLADAPRAITPVRNTSDDTPNRSAAESDASPSPCAPTPQSNHPTRSGPVGGVVARVPHEIGRAHL